ncbi:hypothetical protein QCN29_09385 [Streptomyces sp. HNM0663]|uniref:ABM domain-containing protein n=1 Tax=Streptomyces chengmaiensis TaxID=3040919 RepID=A0ABT6HL68_9ACTN|nr:hypothetical protein [Streptomyces chengmaiensis]MDH2388998.1 hypothetical protein [Streptomyces chengmaiensis]
MAILAHNQSPDWNEELYLGTLERAIPDPQNPPSGLVAHFAGPREGGGWQVIDVWESEEHLRAFLEGAVLPAAKELGAPPFDTVVTEVRNSLIP